MFNYYLGLALRSLKRNVVLTALMIAAVGVGIGASMTTLTVFRAMDQDPIPDKSRQLFAVQIDNWGPVKNSIADSTPDHLQYQVSYPDAANLMSRHAARGQTAMYRTGGALVPDNPSLQPIQASVRAAYTNFFSMFKAPFKFGGPWSAQDDADHANVIVLTQNINDQLFAGANSVGKTVNLDDQAYRVVGVLDAWNPTPRFYDVNNSPLGKPEQIYLPFTRAIENAMPSLGNNNCAGDVGEPGWQGRLHSECVWIQFWAELPTAADVAAYRTFLNNYAADQRHAGRFNWPAHTQIRDVRQWLAYCEVVSNESKILVLVSFSFLFVCLLNAMGLMLAKTMGRASDIGVRRALGANRTAIFAQCLIEAGVVGLAGGLLGLVLTSLGLLGLRSLLSEDIGRLSHFSIADVAISVALAVIATILAGLYPTWRAAQVQPAWQLKAQ